MAYSIDQEDEILALFNKIADQPIVEARAYNEVSKPRPIVEASKTFDGTLVDFTSWTSDSKKVGKAKTASNPDLAKQSKKAPKVTDVSTKGTAAATKGTDKPVTKNDTVTEKKEDKQVTQLVTDDASHEAKGEPKAKSGSFDSAAKSTASAQRSKADSNKKFSEESKKQRKIDMFRDFVKSLGVDKESKEAAEKVLKKFDQISKYIGEPGDGKVKPKLESAFGRELMAEEIAKDYARKGTFADGATRTPGLIAERMSLLLKYVIAPLEMKKRSGETLTPEEEADLAKAYDERAKFDGEAQSL